VGWKGGGGGCVCAGVTVREGLGCGERWLAVHSKRYGTRGRTDLNTKSLKRVIFHAPEIQK
jgi:hypothetical protein